MKKYVIITTNNGYMIYNNDDGDYIHDDNGDNLWDTIDEANNVLNKINLLN